MLISERNREPDEIVAFIPSDRWTISLSTAHVEYPSSKLITDNLDDYARAWGQRQSHTTIQATATTENDYELDYVSVVGINRSIPFVPLNFTGEFIDNEVRLIIDTVPINQHNPSILAGGTFSVTNLTGTYDILNQILNPPEEEITGGYSPSALTVVDPALNTVVNAAFNNDSSRPLDPGADKQVIYIHARDSSDINTVPTLTVTLRQNGVDEYTFPTYIEAEKTTEGYIFTYSWDSVELPNGDDRVSIRITGTSTGTSAPEYLSVLWRSAVTGTLYDSGWQTLGSANNATWVPHVTVPSGTFYIIIQFSDFSQREPAAFVSPPIWAYSPLGESFHAGRFVAGNGISAPLRGMNLRKVGNNAGSLLTSYGGQFRATRPDMTRWQADLTIIPQSQTRMFAELEEFFDHVGFALPALYIPNDGIADIYAQHTDVLWAIISSYEAPDLGLLTGSDTSTDPPHTEDKRFDLRMSIIEAQANLTRRGE